MTLLNVVNGFRRSQLVFNEFESVLAKPGAEKVPLRAFEGRVEETLNHIGWLKNFSSSWSNVDHQRDPRRGRGDDMKNFPQQIPVSPDAKQKFMDSLASQNVSFQKLAHDGIPHG